MKKKKSHMWNNTSDPRFCSTGQNLYFGSMIVSGRPLNSELRVHELKSHWCQVVSLSGKQWLHPGMAEKLLTVLTGMLNH